MPLDGSVDRLPDCATHFDLLSPLGAAHLEGLVAPLVDATEELSVPLQDGVALLE